MPATRRRRQVRNDEELSKLLKDVTIAEGGVLPNIHSVLLKACGGTRQGGQAPSPGGAGCRAGRWVSLPRRSVRCAQSRAAPRAAEEDRQEGRRGRVHQPGGLPLGAPHAARRQPMCLPAQRRIPGARCAAQPPLTCPPPAHFRPAGLLNGLLGLNRLAPQRRAEYAPLHSYSPAPPCLLARGSEPAGKHACILARAALPLMQHVSSHQLA